MKNFLIFLAVLFFSVSASAQITYPCYGKDSLGTTYVAMTVEQAQALDNSTDLLALFEKLNSEIVNYDSVCVRVIGDKDKTIAALMFQIENLKNALSNRDSQIANLQATLGKANVKIINLEKTIAVKDAEINLHLNHIKKVKKRAVIGGTVGGILFGLILHVATHK